METKVENVPPFEFVNRAVIALGGIPNKVQVGDMSIDGRIFPVSASAAPRKKQESEPLWRAGRGFVVRALACL